MDFEFIKMFVNLFISLGAILLLIFILTKVLGGKVNAINDKKYMKIVDRLMVGKDCSLLIVKIGQKAYLISASSKHLEKIDEIPIEEVDLIEQKRAESFKEVQSIYGSFLGRIRESKGKKHED